jgi:AcrR family transcriptional regulator
MAASRRRKPAFAPLKTPRQRRARVTYESILDAAARIISARGYAGLTTNHVADAAGVSIGSVYEYFPDKETIAAEVIRRTLRQIAEALTEALASTKSGADRDGLETALRRCVASLFSILEERRALVSSLLSVPFLHELEEMRALPAAMVTLGREERPLMKSRLFEESPEAWTYIVTTMVMNTVLESVVARPPRLTRQEIQDALTRILLSLMTDRPA